MTNYRVEYTTEDLKWPAYVSTVILEGERLAKAEQVLENTLVVLETYGGPRFLVQEIKSARRTGIFLYEISCLLIDSNDEIKACYAMILNEPWMKANSVAAASFEFSGGENSTDDDMTKLVMKRKKSIKYYKDNEMSYEETNIKNETKIQGMNSEQITDV